MSATQNAGTGAAGQTNPPTPVAGSGPTLPATAGSVAAAPDAGMMATAGAAGSATMPAPTGDFPKNEPVNTDRKGPHAFMSYTMGLDNPTYASSVMYYPTDATPPFASAVFSPGFSATKENYQTFLGELLATHGIAMLLTTPTTTGDQPTQRGEDLVAAVAQIAKENEREGSPLKGKLAVDRVCVTGHSMGGGGTLWAATTLGSKIRCAMPLQPWQPGQSFDKIVAPTMFIAAQSDTIAGVASNAMVFYKSIPDSVEKYYVEFAGASHFLTTNDLGTAYDGQSKYMLAFYKIHLEDDMRYRDVLNAPMDMELSMYLTSFKK
jgi:dienelactone hydrolase